MQPYFLQHTGRRNFLKAFGGAFAAAGVTQGASFVHSAAAQPESPRANRSRVPAKKIPIGVFDPVYDALSLDAMLEKISALGIEAVEIGTGGYPGSTHCPVEDLLADSRKLSVWKKKFEDRNLQVATLSCHGNPVHPDAAIAQRDAETFRRTVLLAERLGVKVIVGFSGCPGGHPADQTPNWITYRWPPELAQAQDWQWKEKVIPYWQQAVKFAREHGIRKLALEVLFPPIGLPRRRSQWG
jgi:sugar phosphate isomerase/epimerase